MKELTLKNSLLKALVDDVDYDKIAHHRWLLSPKGYVIRYEGASDNRKQFRLHNDILELPSGSGIDHIDRNKLNNQRANLRFCSASKNQQNRHQSNNTTGYKGVRWSGRGKARACIGFQGTIIDLGSYPTLIEAAKAYDKKARELYGYDALTNFPLESEGC